jgi:hypothetical protein
MIEILRTVLTETGWLAVVRDSETGQWASLSYPAEPTPAQVLADAEPVLHPPPPESVIEVECEDGTVVP